jgi:Resolvase, N terminal domain
VSEINVAQPPVSQSSATVSSMGHLLGYARVFTTDQQPQLQVDALQRAGCYRVFTETASCARANRPTLEQLLDQLRPRRHPGRLETGPPRPVAAAPGRHHRWAG